MTVLELAQQWAQSPRILLVEDDQAVSNVLVGVLSRYECEVNAVKSVAEGIDSVLQRFYDLIIVDLGLPDGSGVNVIKAAKFQSPLTPVLVMTGGRDWNAIEEALQCGVVSVLLKPFDFEELRRTLGIFKVKATLRPAPVEHKTASATV